MHNDVQWSDMSVLDKASYLLGAAQRFVGGVMAIAVIAIVLWIIWEIFL